MMETKRKSEETCFKNTSKLLLFRFYNNVRAALKSSLTGPCFRKGHVLEASLGLPHWPV